MRGLDEIVADNHKAAVKQAKRRPSTDIAELELRVVSISRTIAALDEERARLLVQIAVARGRHAES